MTQQARASRTHQALISSAAEVFDAHGYVRAKLSSISAGAGVSQGALHFHFTNKEALAEAVTAAAAMVLRRAALSVCRQRTSALQALVDVSHALVRLLDRQVVARAGLLLNREGVGGGRDFLLQWRDGVQRLLERADQEGMLGRQATIPAMTCTIMAATTGISALALGRNPTACDSLTSVWQVLLPAMVVPGALGQLRPGGIEPMLGRVLEPG
ncbi:ScbR family autoregulator-binding transcription factor [Streptacidiphilus sp. PAMC 29251]